MECVGKFDDQVAAGLHDVSDSRQERVRAIHVRHYAEADNQIERSRWKANLHKVPIADFDAATKPRWHL
jgi:hypothetical protein